MVCRKASPPNEVPPSSPSYHWSRVHRRGMSPWTVPPMTQPRVQASERMGYSIGSGVFSSHTAPRRSQVPRSLAASNATWRSPVRLRVTGGQVAASTRTAGKGVASTRVALEGASPPEHAHSINSDNTVTSGTVGIGKRGTGHAFRRVRFSSGPIRAPFIRSAYVTYASRGRSPRRPLPTLAGIGRPLRVPGAWFEEGWMSDRLAWRELATSTVRRWWIPLVLAVVGAVLGVYAASNLNPVYRAQGTVLVGPLDSTVSRSTTLRASESLAVFYADMARREVVLAPVRKQLKLSMSLDDLRNAVSAVVPDQNPRVVTVTVESDSKRRADQI